MKSITIKDPLTGQKMLKVRRTSKGYFCEALNTAGIIPFDCLIITDDGERVTIPMRKKC